MPHVTSPTRKGGHREARKDHAPKAQRKQCEKTRREAYRSKINVYRAADTYSVYHAVDQSLETLHPYAQMHMGTRHTNPLTHLSQRKLPADVGYARGAAYDGATPHSPRAPHRPPAIGRRRMLRSAAGVSVRAAVAAEVSSELVSPLSLRVVSVGVPDWFCDWAPRNQGRDSSSSSASTLSSRGHLAPRSVVSSGRATSLARCCSWGPRSQGRDSASSAAMRDSSRSPLRSEASSDLPVVVAAVKVGAPERCCDWAPRNHG